MSILTYGVSFADDITGTYKNKKNGAVLIIEKSGKYYLATMKSNNKQCDFKSRAVLTKWKSNKGYDFKLIDDVILTATIENMNEIKISVPMVSISCDDALDGVYKK